MKYIYFFLMSMSVFAFAESGVQEGIVVPPAIPNEFILNKDSLYWEKDGVEYKATQLVFSRARFPSYDSATKLISFEFNMSYNITYFNHFAVAINTGLKNSHDNTIARGVIIGSVHNGCNGPAVTFETFNIGFLYKDKNKCYNVLSDTWYKIQVHVSRNWIYYYLYDNNAVLVDSDGVDATEKWHYDEKNQEHFYDYGILQALVGFPYWGDDKQEVHIRNVKFGYYLNE